MGKRRKRIGRIHKNFEKKRQALKINKPGRPRKYTAPSLNDLKGCAVLPSTAWTVSMSEDTLKFHKCKDQPNPQQPVMVTHCLVIKNDLSWHVSVHGSIVSSSSSPLSSVSEHLTRKSLNSLITTLDTATVCAGHPDKHLLEYARSKKGKLLSKTGEVIARVDDTAAVCLNGKAYLETIRSTSCALLVHGSKCSSCTAYRDTLRSSYNQWKKKNKSASERALSISHTNARFLSSPEKKKKISEWKARARAAEMKVHRLVEKLMVSTKKHGIELNEDLHNDLTQIMRDKTNDVQKKYEKKCFQRVFWEQQLQALKAKSPKQYRWHPMMIRWCLHLHMLSSATYRAMQSSGVITLPSQRTLRDYSRWIKSEVGIQPAVTSQLVQEATAKSMNSDLRQYVAVVFDEMKVKEGIVYDKHNLQVVGFVNLGDANNQLVAFQQQLETGDGTPQVAKHMLVFMVRGIFYKLDFPYAQFATRAITADFLYPLLWDVIRHLECAAFKVISVTGDKASANRKLFRMHHSMDSSRDAVTYKVKNPYSEEERYVYFFSDVPHLIKTVRNCWSNSFGHNHKRALWINGQHISWEHIRRVYNRSQCASGLSLLPKLTREHVELNSYSRMRVNLAAQVLSASVSNALQYYNDDDTFETERFVRLFDRFFDCLNTRHPDAGFHARKPDLNPYRTTKDTRLTWLERVFLGYLDEWESSVQKREGFTKAEKGMMMLSRETIEGLKITIKSFLEATRYLLRQPGVQFVLSERFCQDPLESFFGNQRARGGRNDNPTVRQFLDNTVSLRVQGSAALNPVRGNCGKRPIEKNVDETPLPKRPRKK